MRLPSLSCQAAALLPIPTDRAPARALPLYTHTTTKANKLISPPRRPAAPQDLGCKAGVVLNPGTPLSAIEEVLADVDLVLIMSVNPGFGGQKFIESQVRGVAGMQRLPRHDHRA